MSRRQLADKAKISISTLEKALSGRRPFTLATTIRIEEALGIRLRPVAGGALPQPSEAPDTLGSYSRGSVSWIEGRYLTLRPSFSDPDAIYAYRTDILWHDKSSNLIFREAQRFDAAYTHQGLVSIPSQSGHIYLVTNWQGQYRLIMVGRRPITGEMYGIITTLQAGRGTYLTPVATPIALVPIRDGTESKVEFGRITKADPSYERYRSFLQMVTEEGFASFLSVGAGAKK